MAIEEWSWVDWPVVVAIVVAPFMLLWFFFRPKGKKYNLPPGPRKWPLLGHLPVLMDAKRPAHQIVTELAKIHGPVMLLKIGVLNMVFVSDFEAAMEVLKTKDHLFAYRPPGLVVFNYIGYGNNSIALGQLGDDHVFFRKLVVSELLASRKLKGFEAVRGAELDAFIRLCHDASLREESVDMHRQLSSMAVNVISKLAFSMKDSNAQKQWVDLIPEFVATTALPLVESFNLSMKWIDTLTGTRKKMQQTFKKMDTLLQDMLSERIKLLDALSAKELQDYEPKDIMDIMLLHRNGEHSKFITDTAVKAVSLDMIVAGSDTMVTTMEWAMVELVIHPQIMKRAQQELDSVVGKERLVTEADVESLPYLAAILKETFRLHGAVPWLIPHSNRVDCKIGAYDIPANSFINVNVYGLSRDPSVGNDPLKFDPDRFLNGAMVGVDVKGGYPQLMPFGRGRRICPGIAFAHSVMYTVLARLIHTFDWSLPDGQTADKMDMSEKPLGTVKATPFMAVPKPRLATHIYRSL